MAFSQSQLVNRFKDGKTSGKASNMYIEGDVMYSYGAHFPLLVRTPWGFVLNADRYSSSTSQHQSECGRIATIAVSFSALASASIINSSRYASHTLPEQFKAIELIDKSESRYDITGYSRRNKETEKWEYITVSQWEKLNEDNRSIWSECTERRPEAIVLRKDDKYYLSSMDGQNYFVSLLPEPVTTVAEAFESLKPYEIRSLTEHKNGYHRGIHYYMLLDGEYIRQGEWFMVLAKQLPLEIANNDKPLTSDQLVKRCYKAMQADYVLPRPDSSSHSHIATRGDAWNGRLFISGSLRHEEHGMLRLSKADKPVICEVYRNRAVNSWSASGRVD
jgi:hypothetical protein